MTWQPPGEEQGSGPQYVDPQTAAYLDPQQSGPQHVSGGQSGPYPVGGNQSGPYQVPGNASGPYQVPGNASGP